MFQKAKGILIARQLAKFWRRNMSGHEIPDEYRHLIRPTYDVYPLPNQLYSEAYAIRQSKFHKMLLASSALLVTAIINCIVCGTFDFLAPPPRKVNIPLDQLRD